MWPQVMMFTGIATFSAAGASMVVTAAQTPFPSQFLKRTLFAHAGATAIMKPDRHGDLAAIMFAGVAMTATGALVHPAGQVALKSSRRRLP